MVLGLKDLLAPLCRDREKQQEGGPSKYQLWTFPWPVPTRGSLLSYSEVRTRHLMPG